MRKFPKNFVWGVSTSSFQIEGAWNEGGKGPSVWDAFTQIPGKIKNNDNGKIACGHYHKWEEDIALLKSLGVNAYRFSISWARILPTGYGTVNREGIEFYSRLIETLRQNGIEPWPTLHHWDLPLALQFEKDGWLNSEMADYFKYFAAVCFDSFGHKVKNWITLNEPWVTAILGFADGTFAPGRKSDTEPYVVAHNLLRAHGKAAHLYHTQYQKEQKGRIGMANNCDWREPLTDSEQDKAAAQRALEYYLGWFADPVFKGDYPPIMRQNIGERLPRFSQKDREMIQGSCDFFGLNHYTTLYAQKAASLGVKSNPHDNSGIKKDERVDYSSDSSWEKTSMGWNVVPWGFRKLLKWIDQRYEHPEIIVTENGAAFDDKVLKGRVHDERRINYLNNYITEMAMARNEGVNINGYFVWSLLDNFEWDLGYSKRFGLHYVDFVTLERISKDSANWYRDMIKNNTPP